MSPAAMRGLDEWLSPARVQKPAYSPISAKRSRQEPAARLLYYWGVIVVGAGLIGLSCAWYLSRAGRNVRIFDRRDPAREASWAAAGMLAPAGEFDVNSPLLQMSLRSLASYPAFVAALEEESGIAIDFQRCGGLDVALTDEEAQSLEHDAELRRALGIVSEVRCYKGHPACFYPADAIVDPRQLAQALLTACLARGVSIHTNEEVLEIAIDGRSVHTAAAEYADSGVLIAAGAWSSGLYPDLRKTRPVRGHLISYQMAPGSIGTIIRHNHTYVFQRSSGLVIAGSSTENAGFERAIDKEVIADLERRAGSLVPELRSLEPVDRWNGFRPGIEGDVPMIGRLPGSAVFTAFGHYRNGILLAPETALMVSQQVASLSE